MKAALRGRWTPIQPWLSRAKTRSPRPQRWLAARRPMASSCGPTTGQPSGGGRRLRS